MPPCIIVANTGIVSTQDCSKCLLTPMLLLKPCNMGTIIISHYAGCHHIPLELNHVALISQLVDSRAGISIKAT